MVDDHLDQLIAGDKGQKDARNGQDHRLRDALDHCKNPRREIRRGRAYLRGNGANLFIHGVEQPGQVVHDCGYKHFFEPVGDLLKEFVQNKTSSVRKNGPHLTMRAIQAYSMSNSSAWALGDSL